MKPRLIIRNLVQEFCAAKKQLATGERYRAVVAYAVSAKLSHEQYCDELKAGGLPKHARKRVGRILRHAEVAADFAAGKLAFREAWNQTLPATVQADAESRLAGNTPGQPDPYAALERWADRKLKGKPITRGNFTCGLFQLEVQPCGENPPVTMPELSNQGDLAPRLKFQVGPAIAQRFERLGHQSGLNRSEAVSEFLVRLDWERLFTMLPPVTPPVLVAAASEATRPALQPRLHLPKTRRDDVALVALLPVQIRTHVSALATRAGLTDAALAGLLLEPDPTGRLEEIFFCRGDLGWHCELERSEGLG